MRTPYKTQLVYSLFLTIAIPGLLVSTVLWNLQGFAKLIDKELQQQAVLLGDAFTPTALANLHNPDILTASMQLLQSHQPLIREITTYAYTGSTFVTVASTDHTKELQVLNQVTSNLAWTEGKPVASVAIVGTTKERVWSVVSPLFDSNGVKRALLETKISTIDIDTLVTENYTRTGIILGAEIFLILLLLVNYFKFASYARLLYSLQEVDRIRQGLLNTLSIGLQLPALTLRNYASQFSKAYSQVLDIRAREYLEIMLSQANKLVTVVLSLGEYSRVQQGHKLIAPYPLHLDELCGTVCDQIISGPSHDQSVLLNYQRPETQITVTADADVLQQIIFNLLSLLLRYPDIGNIIVRFTYPTSGMCRLLIEPTYLIMTTDVQDTFFKPHLEVTESTTNKFADIGVIYLLSSELVQQMGGRMGVDFSPSGNATFWIQFAAIAAARGFEYRKDL